MGLEAWVLGAFLTALAACIITGTELLYALLFGMFCFSWYAVKKGRTPGNVLRLLMSGMARVGNIIIIFVLIGCLTASWRVSGTIPFILYHSVGLIEPKYFVLCTFLLCCMMSFLTGTSFGTSSTMGVICMMISNTAGLNPMLTAGSILSGVFFGDRCSPMSSSALLVNSLTETDIYRNIKGMVKTSWVPFLITCVLYIALAGNIAAEPDHTVTALFEENFSLSWVTAMPAVLMLLLAILRVDVKIAMGVSIIAASAAAIMIQGVAPGELIYTLWTGGIFEEGSRLAVLLNGGGISSMVEVGAIVLISASYSGIFSVTPLLSGVKENLKQTSVKLTPFGTVILTSLLSSMVSCNQSLGTILTWQICDDLYQDKEELAIALENSVILVAALIPWGIAGAVPVATIGAEITCLPAAFYLYLVPAWNLWLSVRKQKPGRSRSNEIRIS